MNKKFGSLTGLRALAAIIIFVYHNRKFGRNFFPDIIDRFFNEFHIGVALFFVLSGFLITYNYYEKFNMFNTQSYFKYLWIRIARVYPIYLIIICCKYVFTTCPPTLEVMMNLTLLKGYFFKYLLTGLPQSWSLTVEITFYILAPFIFWFIAHYGILKTIASLTAISILSFAVAFGFDYYKIPSAQFLFPSHFFIIGTFQGRFMEFIMGCLLALHLKSIKNIWFFRIQKHNTIIGSTGILLCMAAMMHFQTSIWTHGFENNFGAMIHNLILPIFIAIMIKGLINEPSLFSKLLSTKVFEQLGYASFIFYLIHINFINSMIWDVHVFPDRNFTILWIVSLAGYYLLEKPIYLFLRGMVMKPASE